MQIPIRQSLISLNLSQFFKLGPIGTNAELPRDKPNRLIGQPYALPTIAEVEQREANDARSNQPQNLVSEKHGNQQLFRSSFDKSE